MKYIAPALFCGVLTLQSCENFLDTKPTESYSEELVWGSKSTIDAFVLQTYNNIMPKYHDIETEESWTLNTVYRVSCPDITKDLVTKDMNWGFGDFGTIRRCNLIIENVQKSAGLTDGQKTELVAEGKMLRAMTYFYQVKHCGRVIWIDRVLQETDEFNLPLTKSIDESYDYVISDINDAVAGLPNTSARGRMNANAARALKSEICITAAAYTTDATRKKSLFEQAVAAVDAIQGYSLDNNYGGMFNQENGKTSPEIILGQYFSKDNTWGQNTLMQNMIPNQNNENLRNYGFGPFFVGDERAFDCWLQHSPSQNLVDDYLVIDRNDNSKAVKWNQSSQFVDNTTAITTADVEDLAYDNNELDENTLAYKLNSTSKETKLNDVMFADRDKRFEATFVYDSCMYYNQFVTLNEKGNLNRLSYGPEYGSGRSHVPNTNYAWRKYVYVNSPKAYYNTPTDYHYVIFRYGRALLNKAEALLCLAKNDPSKIAAAVETFNQTRTVHGGLPASTATTLADAWTDYKRERHVDLALEGDYYWTLLRWGMYGGEANHGKPSGDIIPELNTPATFIEISKNRHRMFIGKVLFQNDARRFSVKRYLFAIPQGVINANSAINDSDQNPGW